MDDQISRIAVAVVQRESSVLIAPRPSGAPLAGLWEFPGGKILPGESLQEAAARECLEETGLAVRIVRRLAEETWQYPHGRLRLHFLAAEPLDASGKPRPPFRWVPVGELDRYEFPPANADVIRRLFERQAGG